MNKKHITASLLLASLTALWTMLTAQPSGNNYIYKKTFRNASGSVYSEDISFYNGLGYLDQTMELDVFSGDARVSMYKMDPMRRLDAKAYLPFIFDVDMGSYLGPAATYQAEYYEDRTSRPFVETVYERGSAGRPLSVQKAGDVYQTDGRRLEYLYGYNTAADGIRDLQYHYRNGSFTSSSNPPYVVNAGILPANSLYMTRTVTEDHDTSFVFRDAYDKTICERRMNEGLAHDTYYVYDLTDRLVCVIQPEGSTRLGSSFSFGDTFANKYCFTFEYDARGRLIRRYVPGSGEERFAYDLRDRMVYCDDALMRANNIGKYIIYDAMDRIVEEGFGEGPDESWNYLTLVIEEGEFPEENGFEGDLHPTRQVWYVPDHCSWDLFREEEDMGLTDTDVDWNHCRTMISYERIWDAPSYGSSSVMFRDSTFTERQYYYDNLGRLLQVAEKDRWTGLYSWHSYNYNHQGQVTSELERHAGNINADGDWVMHEHSYDIRGRKTGTTISSDGFSRSVALDYDDMDRLATMQTGAVTETRSYNLQGWLSTRNTLIGSQSVLQNWNYYDLPAANRRYDGKIRNQVLQFSLTDNVLQQYEYDHLGRLSGYGDSRGGTEDYRYDRNGNLVGITTENIFREALTTRTFDGNRMTCQSIYGMDLTTDGEIEFDEEYEWNANGALSETDNGDSFTYNVLGSLSGYNAYNTGLDYRYLSDGTKVSGVDFAGKGLEYRGSFIYRKDGSDSGRRLESIAMPTGRLYALESSPGVRSWSDRHFVQNQVGSTVAVVELGHTAGGSPTATLLEKTSYSPYGDEMYTFGTTRDSLSRFRFNGKELQDMIGNADPGLLDYGARMFSPLLSSWTSPDPLADKYFSLSPYAFCAGDPVNYVDPSGETIDFTNAFLENSEVTNKIILDLCEKTGLSLSLNERKQLVYQTDDHGNPMIMCDSEGNCIGSPTARDMVIDAIEHSESVSVFSLDNKSSSGGGHQININGNQVEGFINGSSVDINSSTMGYAMTFLHELSHTDIGGNLQDPYSVVDGSRVYIEGIPGQVEDKMNQIRQELGRDYGQRMSYTAFPMNDVNIVPFSFSALFSLDNSVFPSRSFIRY